ncbi:MAG: YihY/virulence factor BrkB family protein [Hyphomicrobiales bacterium]|nr:YihY/virulence factor BrkB family protein [Hyphomicrobiales bacterium]MDE2115611.1 YihY/virulence factor BrkB family protein [Hyphomicrobiales bacterium]
MPGPTHDSQKNFDPAQGEDWRSVERRGLLQTDRALALRAAERGRGRTAHSPAQFPVLAWRDIIWRTIRSVPQDRIFATSGSVAFFGLLAIFPAIATLISLYGLIADATTIHNHLSLLEGVLPRNAITLFDQQMLDIAAKRNNTLGIASIVSFAIALWSANSGIVALLDALNVVYKEREKRSWLRLYATAFLFTLGAIAVVAASIGLLAIFGSALQFLGLGGWVRRLVNALRWPLLLGLAFAALSLLYRYGPSRAVAKWRWISAGSVAAAIAWIGMSMLFSWYVGQFNSYNRVYGSLGAIAGLMTWIWFSVVVALIGAELNAAMELQTMVDTTAGTARPLGLRGAMVADQIGESPR